MAGGEIARRTRRHEQGDRSREEILDAASALMSGRGFDGTSMARLAEQSGLPVSSIYWHFSSKAGVLAAVMERGAQRFFTGIEAFALPPGPEPRTNLLVLMRHSDETVREHPEFLRLFMQLLLESEGQVDQAAVVARVRAQARQRLHDALRRSYAPWGSVLAETVAGELVDILFALFDGVFIAGLVETRAGLVEQLVDAVHALAEAIRSRDDVY